VKYWTRYLPSYINSLVYMLQTTDYRYNRYVTWLHRTADFRSVMRRSRLEHTSKARLLIGYLRVVYLATILTATLLIYDAYVLSEWWPLTAAAMLILAAPLVLAYGLLLPLLIGHVLIQGPREQAMVAKAERIVSGHSATRIAVVGSYGKTTAKELLNTVLAEGLDVAATPGNMNTPIGISRFVNTLDGGEAVLVFEYGEERVGDVRALARLTHPDLAIITGINEAHLDSFKSLDRTISTIFEIADFVDEGGLYKNDESRLVHDASTYGGHAYSRKGVAGWKVTNAQTSVEGTAFTLAKGAIRIKAQTGLVGLHTVGVTAAVAAIAFELGLTAKQIETGLRKVVPFEHRMAPRPLHGAWIIDDTYNGNSDGMKAGLAFLKDSKAKRRVYVTPGLVEQGSQTESVHVAIGEQAAQSADVVVLMRNSVLPHILKGLENKHYKGELEIIEEPLVFYSNLEHFVAAGDIVLMQNDWTDNYQ
jgi:UDP-N-acetylmuramyl pentapeptide synthase